MNNKLSAGLPKPSIDAVQIYLLGGEGLLFNLKTRQLYYLNTTATYIWCALLEGMEPPRIAEAIATQFNVPPDRAHLDVSEALSAWAQIELQTTSGTADVTLLKYADKRILTSDAASHSSTPEFEVNSITAVDQSYRLDTHRFQIRYATQSVAACVHPVLAHLTVETSSVASDAQTSIEVVSTGELYQLRVRGRVQAEGLTEEELAPLINAIMLRAAFESSGCLAAFHSGAVGNARACVLLPGEPGSGKSTLVAALVEAGYRYLTDELALLMPNDTIRPLRVSLGLKRGSWPLFRAALANQFKHRQANGSHVRYLPTPVSRQSVPPLQALVFPRYFERTETRLTPLSPARALYELSVAGYAVGRELDYESVGRLVAWITPLRCYQLQVGELGSAVTEVRKILA